MPDTALIVVDMLNTYEHEDADDLKPNVERILEPLSRLIDRAPGAGWLTVYVNDNDADWSAGRRELIAKALGGRAPELVEAVIPPPGIPFVVKARHSVFYETQLEYILRQEGVRRVVLAGQVTEQCVFYSALDAYVRHFEVTVPRDVVAHIHENLAGAALEMMERNMRAQICDTAEEVLSVLNGSQRT